MTSFIAVLTHWSFILAVSVIGLYCGYLVFARIKETVNQLTKDIQTALSLIRSVNEETKFVENPSLFFQQIQVSKQLADDLKAFIGRFEKRLLMLKTDFGTVPYSIEPIRNDADVHDLINRRLDIRRLELWPGVFTGGGLLLTFVFLALALISLGKLTGAEGLTSLNEVLAAASGKFSTSIVGLACGIWLSFVTKKALSDTEQAVFELTDGIESIVSDRGAEEGTQLQLQLLGEVLNESREQVGQLKRFETDFAVSIASAIDKVLNSRMEAVVVHNNRQSERVLEALTNIQNATETTGREMVERIGSINEQALGKMVTDLQGLVRDSMSAEMEGLKSGLVALAAELRSSGEAMSQSIVSSAENFAESIGKSTSHITEASNDFAQYIKNGGNYIKEAARAAGDSLSNSGKQFSDSISTVLRQFSNVFEASCESLLEQLKEVGTLTQATMNDVVLGMQKSALELAKAQENASKQNEQLTEKLMEAAEELESVFADISDNFKDTSVTVTAVIDGFKTSGSRLDSTVNSLNDNTQKFIDAAASIQAISTTMKSAAEQMASGSREVVSATTSAMSKFEDMAKLLTRTNTELGGTLDSMNSGLSTYATKLRDLHQSLDFQLAKALSSLENSIGEMTEAFDEVSDKLEKISRKAA